MWLRKSNTKKALFGIATVVAAVMLLARVNENKTDDLEIFLRNDVIETKKKLPRKIDEFTILKNIHYINKKRKGLRYDYYVTFSRKEIFENVGIAKFIADREKSVREFVCNRDSGKELLRKGIVIEMAYYGRNKKLIGVVDVTEGGCLRYRK